MTPSRYHEGIFILPCPYCNSTDVEESGDDFDGEVSCNTCSLGTPTFYGTKNAINAWNERKYFDRWMFFSSNEQVFQFLISI